MRLTTDLSDCKISKAFCRHGRFRRWPRCSPFSDRLVRNRTTDCICFSKPSKKRKKWTVIKRECLAVVWAITDQFHCYVYGSKFTVRTDNQLLKWLQLLRKPSGRIARWIIKLQEYDYEIIHFPGSTNRVADALSRIPTNALYFRNDTSIEELRKQQRLHPDLMPVIDSLHSSDEVRPDAQLSSNTWQLRRIDELKLVDDVLVRSVNRNGKSSEQAVVDRQAAPHTVVAEFQAPPVALANAVEAPPLEADKPQPEEARDHPTR